MCVESWDLASIFTCLFWLALQVSEEEGEAAFVVSVYVLLEPGWGPAFSRQCTCLSCSWPHTSVSESE